MYKLTLGLSRFRLAITEVSGQQFVIYAHNILTLKQKACTVFHFSENVIRQVEKDAFSLIEKKQAEFLRMSQN
jgi:hypothetical protein